MDSVKPHTLNKTERLKSRKRIDQLFREGQRFPLFPFYVYFEVMEDEGPSVQAGFGVSSKTFKKAVDRNRIKRVTKEAYRVQKHALENAAEQHNKRVMLFLVYTAKELPEYTFVSKKITSILERLIKHLNENLSIPA